MFAIPSNYIFRGKERLWFDIGLNLHAGGLPMGGRTGCLDVFVAIVGFPGTGGLFNSILRLLEFL